MPTFMQGDLWLNAVRASLGDYPWNISVNKKDLQVYQVIKSTHTTVLPDTRMFMIYNQSKSEQNSFTHMIS